jgi:LmbE family N-acetylglucosaminyl deacetylase
MNVLFVGAHPDDIEIFCGGTAALYAKQGHQVFFCVSTNGNVGSATLPLEEIAAIRHKEAENGAAVIGAKLIWLNFDDEFLFDTRESRLAFIEAFRQARPEVVICHWRQDYHPDHSISGTIVDECVIMAGIPNIKTASPPVAGNNWMKKMFGYELEAFLEIPARFRGLQAGCKMAEAFRPSYRWGRTFREHYLPDALLPRAQPRK